MQTPVLGLGARFAEAMLRGLSSAGPALPGKPSLTAQRAWNALYDGRRNSAPFNEGRPLSRQVLRRASRSLAKRHLVLGGDWRPAAKIEFAALQARQQQKLAETAAAAAEEAPAPKKPRVRKAKSAAPVKAAA